MKLNRAYRELFLRDIYKNLSVEELLYCVGAKSVIMTRRETAISSELFEVEFYGSNNDRIRVVLYLKQAILLHHDLALSEKGYYCIVYHYKGNYNDTARSVFIKCDGKTRLALVDKYKYWSKPLTIKRIFSSI